MPHLSGVENVLDPRAEIGRLCAYVHRIIERGEHPGGSSCNRNIQM